MSNRRQQPNRQLVNTLGEVADKYGVTLPTLKSMISLYPLLHEKLKPFFDGQKRIFPPAIIDDIYKTLGEP